MASGGNKQCFYCQQRFPSLNFHTHLIQCRQNSQREKYNNLQSLSKQWSCPICTFENAPNTDLCTMCQQGKKPKTYNNNINNKAFPPQQHKQNHDWKCSKCTFVNDKTRSLCKMCSNPQSSSITTKSNNKKKNRPNKSYYDSDGSSDEWEVCDIVHTTSSVKPDQKAKAAKTEDVDKLAQQIQDQLSLKSTHDEQQLLLLEQKMKQQQTVSEQQLTRIQQKLAEITLMQQQQEQQQKVLDKQRKYLEEEQKQEQLSEQFPSLSHHQMLTQKQIQQQQQYQQYQLTEQSIQQQPSLQPPAQIQPHQQQHGMNANNNSGLPSFYAFDNNQNKSAMHHIDKQKQNVANILKDDVKHNENIENQGNNVIEQNILDTMGNDIDGVNINDMNGPTKQFYLFLKDHRLEKYFTKFEENSCCDIRDIEYLVNDENFLQKDIGMKNVIERRRFLGESRKLKNNMDLFKNANIPSILLVKLSKFGVVTFDILCNEVQNTSDLKNKFNIYNDNQCDLLWSLINSHLNPQKNDNEQQYQQEGVNKNVKETDYI